MVSVQLKMWMGNLGIVFRIMNSGWQQKHEWPHENSQCKKYWIMHHCSDKGLNKGTKQASGHNCLPFKGATDHSAYGVGRFQRAWEISFGVTILVPETWGPMRMGLTERWGELYSPYLIQNSFSQLHPPRYSANLAPIDIYCFPNSNLPHKGQRHAITENGLKTCYRLEGIPPEQGARLIRVSLGLSAESPRTNGGMCDAWCFCCSVCGAFKEQGWLGCGMWGLWEGTVS